MIISRLQWYTSHVIGQSSWSQFMGDGHGETFLGVEFHQPLILPETQGVYVLLQDVVISVCGDPFVHNAVIH